MTINCTSHRLAPLNNLALNQVVYWNHTLRQPLHQLGESVKAIVLLTEIAEIENDLRTERQAEGIAKARENGVKFGRPPKLTNTLKEEIYSRRMAGATIGQLAKEFSLGEASIYRAINAVKQS